VALMTEALRLPLGGTVLEVGAGSGYQAAVLAELTPHVYTIEIVKPLADEAAARLRRLGYTTVAVRAGDGYFGWSDAGPFDAIIVPCAAESIPQPLWDQLRPGGRIVVPIGSEGGIQYLTVITKAADGRRQSETLIPCTFVPMTGEIRGSPR
jgi:protein-L-isoaspartate(D-aspartate) O-methyltransferase